MRREEVRTLAVLVSLVHGQLVFGNGARPWTMHIIDNTSAGGVRNGVSPCFEVLNAKNWSVELPGMARLAEAVTDPAKEEPPHGKLEMGEWGTPQSQP